MSYTTYLRWAAVSAIFLALFVPFIIAEGGLFPNLFFPFIVGKNFAFRILVELALICYVLLALKEPKYRPRGSWLMWTVVLFVAWMAIATTTSVDPIKSFWSNFERMEGYIGLLHLFVWFVITGTLLAADDLWDWFFNTSVVLASVQGIWALMQAVGILAISSQSGARADTTFGNATYLAVYLLLNFFLTLFLLVRRKHSPGTQSLYGLALVLQFAGLYLTETRGALLGLGAGLVVAALYMVFFAREKEWQWLRTLSLWGLGALVVLVALFFAVRDTAFVHNSNTLNRLASISLTDRTTQSRFLIWHMALQGAQEKPVFGWGQENFSYVFNKYYDPQMYNQESWFDRAHNQFLDWLVAGGLPAFVLYIALYVLALYLVWRSRLAAPQKAVLVGLFAGFIFNNLLVFDNLVSAMYFFVLLAFVHSLSRQEPPSAVWLSRPMREHALAIAAPVVIAAGLVGAWALNAPALVRGSTLISALQTQEAGLNSSGAVVGVNKDPKKNLASFEAALGDTSWPGNPLGKQEATEQLLQYASNIAASTSVAPQTKQDVFTAAKAAIDALLQARPGDARLELFAATFLSAYGQNSDAFAHLQAALQDSPKKQQIMIQIGGVLLTGGHTADGLAVFKQTFELEPEFDMARIYYAAGLYYAGQTSAADALLKDKFGSAVVDNDQLLQVYAAFKLYDRAIAIWQLRVSKNPNDVQTHLGLASAYFAAGKKAETISELKAIEKIQPAAAAQMEQLIKQINDGTLKPQ